MLSSRLQIDINVSSYLLYVTSWKYSFVCSHQEKWHLGSWEELGISATLLHSFPSRCTDAAEVKTWQEEFNSELKCRKQGKEGEVTAQLICKSQTYLGWWIMSCQDYMWQQKGWTWSGIIELIMGKFLYLHPVGVQIMSSKQGERHTKPGEQGDKVLSVRERHQLKKGSH